MKIFYSPYQLQKKTKLNSRDQSDIQTGVLIKLVKGDYWGVADLSCKPELGDETLEKELQGHGDLYSRTLELAEEDLKARIEKKSLLQNKFIKNNYLITDYKNTDLNDIIYINQTVKIKGDRDVQKLAQSLNSIKIDMFLRIDFNSILENKEYDYFLNSLSVEARNKIKYVEEPTLYNEKWKAWNNIIPLALDFQKAEYNPDFAQYRIIKPSRERLPKRSNYITFTSAMEHPVGLAHGLRIAQQLAQNDSGFLTLNLFENADFHKYFMQKDNLLNFSELALNDTGIGMTEELLKLNWTEL